MDRSRRTLLRLGMMGAATGALAQARGGAARDRRRERIAVATWPFRARLLAPHNTERVASVPGVDLAGFAEYVVRQFGVWGIEPLDQHFPSTEAAYMHELRAALDRLGAHVGNIPVDEPVDLGDAREAVRAHGYGVYRRWIENAVILRSPSIRIAVPRCGGASDVAGPAAALRPVADYGAQRGVVVQLENDDPELASAARIVAILRVARHPNLRALPDFANSLMGGDEAFNVAAVREMFAFAGRMAHVKDAEEIAGQHRTAKLPELFAVARGARYAGGYSMESDSRADPELDTRHLIEKTLALM